MGEQICNEAGRSQPFSRSAQNEFVRITLSNQLQRLKLLPTLPLCAGGQQHGYVDLRGLNAHEMVPGIRWQIGQLGAQGRVRVPDHALPKAGRLLQSQAPFAASQSGGKGRVHAIDFARELKRAVLNRVAGGGVGAGVPVSQPFATSDVGVFDMGCCQVAHARLW